MIDHFFDLLVGDKLVRLLLLVNACVALQTCPYFIGCYKIPVAALAGYLGPPICIHLVPFTADYAHPCYLVGLKFMR
jgi:hypothetical protein